MVIESHTRKVHAAGYFKKRDSLASTKAVEEILRNLGVYVPHMLSSPHYLPQCRKKLEWRLHQVPEMKKQISRV